MKKYLMLGVAALALASCNKNDFTPMTQGEVDKAKYDAAFEKYVGGQVASNQTWGFGGVTRAGINVNGNLWATCPELGPTEDADVTNYVRNLTTYNTEAPTGLVNYYVTQVHCGTDTYTDGDNSNVGVGSALMNHLMIAMQSTATIENGVLSGDWVHINNFNRGDDTDWKGNTLVTDGGTFNFAYLGSNDSRYHNKWCAVDGASIDPQYAPYYYICFNFEQTAPVKTVIKFRDSNNTPQQGYIDGEWHDIQDCMGKTVTISVGTWNGSETVYENVDFVVGQEGTSEWSLDNVVNGNQKVDADQYYDDWIIRLVKAQPAADLRIIAEDLNANSSDNDWDFNDVVLDIKYGATADDTKVTLQAAGGTLELRIAENDEWEVHKLFDVPTTTMVNTNLTGANGAKKDPVVVPYNQAIPDADAAKALKIEVKKNGVWQELTANVGEPACKIGVKPTFQWLNERQSIKATYPEFTKWVTEDPTIIWY